MPNPSQPLPPPGREFERVPRVLESACEANNRAVVFFHSSDNPYGNPKGVAQKVLNRSIEGRRERFYGIANKLHSARFPKFSDKVHVIRPELIPGPKDGTDRLIVDPAGRNFFMAWFRATAEAVYIYREWPGNYYIEGIGVPGPWALPDGKKPDGRMGPAQKSFGWGYLRYKEEIARLEGWTEYKKGCPDGMSHSDWLKSLDALNGSEEPMHERYIDSRFASEAKMENDRPTTLLTDFEEIGLFFQPTVGGDARESINEGVQKINDALDYDEEKPVDYFNRPKLYISSECVNLIFAFSTWTGMTEEGKTNMTGATKDPIDVVRYYFLAGCDYVGPGDFEAVGGGHYL